jgi:CRISPR-associated protein (TIGR02710 family)
MSKPTLLCTVGGSHQPILTAIREVSPSFVTFFCSGADPATGKPGSRTQVEGKGTPVEVMRHCEVVERLPNIPTQAGLTADAWAVCEVPADDLDTAVHLILAEIDRLRASDLEAPLIADYTGGTKTMTAALAIAALERPGVELRLVTGARADLVKVHDGTQSSGVVGVEGIRLRRGMAPFLAAWDRFAYGEAAVGLAGLPTPRDSNLRAKLQIARDLSRAFDAWDRFDHRAARDQIDVYRSRLGGAAAPWFNVLKHLAAGPEEARRTPARLWDLWLNAQRRAAQCRYDDAVARGYRLLEWTAQWLLSTIGIDTGALREDQIPPGIPIHPGEDGRRQAALRNAWDLAAHHLGGEVQRFVQAERDHLLDHLRKRNYSILAHGDLPITRGDWEAFSTWIESALIPLLRGQAAPVGLKTLAPQLPRQPLWS